MLCATYMPVKFVYLLLLEWTSDPIDKEKIICIVHLALLHASEDNCHWVKAQSPSKNLGLLSVGASQLCWT